MAIGSLSWVLTMFKSGLRYGYGIGFWGPNGHDGVWHISLINSLSKGNFDMPIFAGENLKNYHIGYDLLLSIVHRLAGIPASVLYFQIFPTLIALSIGLLTYMFIHKWTGSKAKAFWSTFFVYFGGNFGWIISLVRNGDIGGESTFWSQQAVSTLINPPFALSLVFILAGLIAFLHIKKPKPLHITLLVLSFGLLIQIKAYAGLIILSSLLLTSIYYFYKEQKLKLLLIWLASAILSAAIFIPFNKNSSSLIEFKPFWFLETMMLFPDRVGWTRFGEAMVNYRTGGVLLKGTIAYLVALLIFWYGNMGTRLVAEIYYAKLIIKKKKPDIITFFLSTSILVGCTATLLFVQKGNPWNTIQFFYYTLFFSGLIAGVTFGGIIETKKNLKFNNLLIGGMLLFTVPTSLGTLKHYIPSRPPAMISNFEIEALEFLENQPDGIVLTTPYDRFKAEEAASNPPRPLYLYESTSYISAFSEKQVFLEDEVNLEITGYAWQPRRKQIEDYFSTNDSEFASNFLEENNIKYIYLPQKLFSNQPPGHVEEVFRNQEVTIYKVN